MIEILDELTGGGEAVKARVGQVEATWRSTRGGRAVDDAAIERQGAAGAAAIERASHQAVLQGLDVDQPRVGIEGKEYRRVGRYEADYYTMAGPVRVTRTLYREQGQRNAKTVNAVSLRCGVVGEGWLPGTAQARAGTVNGRLKLPVESGTGFLPPVGAGGRRVVVAPAPKDPSVADTTVGPVWWEPSPGLFG